MSETTHQFKRQLPKNAIMAVLSFMAYALSSVWLTPYLVGHLGPAAYGLVPIAGLFTQYVSIITSNLSAAVNRFLTIELQKKDGNPNAIFNSAVALYAMLIVIQLPLFYFGIRYADHLFTIPAELKTDAILLLGWSAGGFLLSLMVGVFGVSVYSKNRLDISASVGLVYMILRLVLIITCFSVWGPKLRFIGFIDFFLNILMVACSVFYWKKFTPELYLSVRQVDLKILRPIFSMSIWTIINQMGTLLYLRSDIWIINRFISPVAAGVYAAVLVAANFIRQLGHLSGGQLGPISMRYWARGESQELGRLLRLSVKVLSIALAVPAAILCIYGGRILGMWLGPEYARYSLLLLVLCFHLPVNVAIFPFFQLQAASNSVRFPAFIAIVVGLLNAVLSYVLGVTFGMGALGVAAATAAVMTVKNAIFTPLHGAHVLGIPPGTFFKPQFSGFVMLGLVWLISLGTRKLVPGGVDSGFLGLLLEGILITLIAGALGWFLFLSKAERNALLGLLPEKIRGYAGKLGIGV